MGENHPSDHRIFVSYIDKSREFYLAQGYGNPYRWASFDEAPFARLTKPLSEARVGLVTTASLMEAVTSDEPFSVPATVYAAPADPAPAGLYTEHRSWDKEATHTRDVDSFLPLHRLQEAVASGRVGSASPRFYGVPTVYSQRRTIEEDAPAILDMCREDAVDAVILCAL